MNRQHAHTGSAVAYAARINAAAQDAAAARACMGQLESQCVAARARADQLAAQLLQIQALAQRALAHATDDQVRLILGHIAITAAQRGAR